MSARIVLVACLILVTTASADTWKPTAKVSFEKAPTSPPPASPTPIVTILTPANLEMEKTQPKKTTPYGKDGVLVTSPCGLTKDVSIKVKAENWKVAPGGNGVAVVIDNRWGVVLHDLSKPIKLASFVPVFTGNNQESRYVDGNCGWHFVAAFATYPSGESVKTDGALAVNYFHLGDGGDDIADIQGKIVMILNTPMLGTSVEEDKTDKHNAGGGFAGGETAAVDFLFWNLKTPLSGSNLSVNVGLGGENLGKAQESYGPYLIKHLSKGVHQELAIYFEQSQTNWNTFYVSVPYYNEH
jgi:hypothetical protein